MAFLAQRRGQSVIKLVTAALLAIVVTGGAVKLLGQQTTYTIYYADGRRNLLVRAGSPETLALEQLATPFGLTFTEDRGAGGLVIGTRKGNIVVVPGQSFINVAGRVVGLDAPIRRERSSWIASLDFLTKALGPAIGEPIIIRRSSRLVLVGNVQVPQVSGRVEKTQGGARVVISIQPFTPHRVSRDGNKLVVRFDANALDATPLTGFVQEFATAARIEGTVLTIDLGPQAAGFRTADDRAQETLTIDLLPPVPVAPVPIPSTGRPLDPAPPPGPPQIDLAPGVRSIVLDPGHGGEDEGVLGAGGTKEKDLTLQIARRLKATIESRLGLRVLMTRDADEATPLDRRSAFANNNKADLFISLHANGSVRASARGAQVYSLDPRDYPQPAQSVESRRRTVPVLGGGTRIIDPMPWDLAQLPYADHSATFAGLIVQHLTEKGVVLHGRSNVAAPLRALAGANMPAVLIEVGFLSNTQDEAALTSADGIAALVEALVAAISDVRRGFSAGEGRHRP
jgi:N-acetylmuramoyl-L-alanine amidase